MKKFMVLLMLVISTFSFGYQIDRYQELGFYKRYCGEIVSYQKEKEGVLDSVVVVEDMNVSEFEGYIVATMYNYGDTFRGIEKMYATDTKRFYRAYCKGYCVMITFEIKDGVYYNSLYTPKSNKNATPRDKETQELLQF